MASCDCQIQLLASSVPDLGAEAGKSRLGLQGNESAEVGSVPWEAGGRVALGQSPSGGHGGQNVRREREKEQWDKPRDLGSLGVGTPQFSSFLSLSTYCVSLEK